MTAASEREVVLGCFAETMTPEEHRYRDSLFARIREAAEWLVLIPFDSASDVEKVHADRFAIAARCDGAIIGGSRRTAMMKAEAAAVTAAGGWVIDLSHIGGIPGVHTLAKVLLRHRNGLRLPQLLASGAFDKGPKAVERWFARDPHRRWRKGS